MWQHLPLCQSTCQVSPLCCEWIQVLQVHSESKWKYGRHGTYSEYCSTQFGGGGIVGQLGVGMRGGCPPLYT